MHSLKKLLVQHEPPDKHCLLIEAARQPVVAACSSALGLLKSPKLLTSPRHQLSPGEGPMKTAETVTAGLLGLLQRH